MFDHLLESSHRDDSNRWSNIGFGQEIMELASIEVYFMHLIWSSGSGMCKQLDLDEMLSNSASHLSQLFDIRIMVLLVVK